MPNRSYFHYYSDRWLYRIEGLLLGTPLSFLIVVAFGERILPLFGALGIFGIIVMQLGGVHNE